MNKLLAVIDKLLHPPKWILLSVPWMVFAVLLFILTTGHSQSTPAYIIYGMSAYSLVIWILAIPKLIKQIRTAISNSKAVQKIFSHKIIRQYFNNLSFRGSISIYQGIAVNLFYAIFRLITGICYASVWFLSMAVYYFVLCSLRTYLIIYYHRDTSKTGIRCYQRTAFSLFLLNIPMGGMILLMVQTNSGYSYPGYIIYVSALYTFYTMTVSIINLVKFRKLGNPILSAAKVLNFISAMMSILGLQTAMISQFSKNGESYRKMMNIITGGSVYGVVILIAVYMLLHSKKIKKDVKAIEPIRK